MPSFLTAKQVAEKFPKANLSALPTADPGGGKPWLRGGVITVGPGSTIGWESLAGALPLDKLPAHTHSWNDLPGLLPAAKLPLHTHSDLVPYTGATGPVDLGSFGLTTPSITAPSDLTLRAGSSTLMLQVSNGAFTPGRLGPGFLNGPSQLGLASTNNASVPNVFLNSVSAGVASLTSDVGKTTLGTLNVGTIGVGTPTITGNGLWAQFGTTGGLAGAVGNFGNSLMGLGLISSNGIFWNSLGNTFSSGSVSTTLTQASAGTLQVGTTGANALGSINASRFNWMQLDGTTRKRIVDAAATGIDIQSNEATNPLFRVSYAGTEFPLVVDRNGIALGSNASNNISTVAGSLVLAPFNGQLWFGSVGAAGMRTSTELGLASNASINFTSSSNNFYSGAIDLKIDRPSASNLRLSNPIGPVVQLSWAGNDRSGGLSLNGQMMQLGGNRPQYQALTDNVDGNHPDFLTGSSNGATNYYGLWRKANTPGVMQVKHGVNSWSTIETGLQCAMRSTFASYGPYMQGINESGRSEVELQQGLIAGYGGTVTCRAGDVANTGFVRMRYNIGFPMVETNRDNFNFSTSAGGLQFASTYISQRIGSNVYYHAQADGTISNLFRSHAAASVPLVARGAVSQTGNLFEAQNSAGTTLASVLANGTVNAVAYQISGSQIFAQYTHGALPGAHLDVGGAGGYSVVRLGGTFLNPNTLIPIGGVTNAFPALRRNGTTLEARLADDSAFTSFTVAGLGVWGTTPPAVKPTLPTNPTNAEIAALLSTYGLCTLV